MLSLVVGSDTPVSQVLTKSHTANRGITIKAKAVLQISDFNGRENSKYEKCPPLFLSQSKCRTELSNIKDFGNTLV